MKAISLWQPWASLWLSPRKIHETRHWQTSHRGWLAVHAAKRFDDVDVAQLDLLVDEFGKDWEKVLPQGAVIGLVDLIACVPAETVYGDHLAAEDCDDLLLGDFSPGRYAWRRGEFKRLKEPLPFTGLPGFFEVPDDIMNRETV